MLRRKQSSEPTKAMIPSPGPIIPAAASWSWGWGAQPGRSLSIDKCETCLQTCAKPAKMSTGAAPLLKTRTVTTVNQPFPMFQALC